MTLIESYLGELFGKNKFVDPNDPSLPNPYNFRQLKLDPKITSSDIQKANKKWAESKKKGWTGPAATFADVIKNTRKKWTGGKLYVIVDKGKRVGIVGFEDTRKDKTGASILYVVWVKGKSYATAGIMKLLNMPDVPQWKKFRATFDPQNANIASIRVGEKLKAKKSVSTEPYYQSTWFEISPPYWWNNNKFLKY